MITVKVNGVTLSGGIDEVSKAYEKLTGSQLPLYFSSSDGWVYIPAMNTDHICNAIKKAANNAPVVVNLVDELRKRVK